MNVITFRDGRGVIIKEVSETDISGKLAHAACPQLSTFVKYNIISHCISA